MAEREVRIVATFEGSEATKGLSNLTGKIGAVEGAAKGGAQQLQKLAKPNFKEMASNSNAARESMLNLQYSLRDSPYLFQSLQMGVTAAGENIALLVQSMATLKSQSGGLKNTLGVLGAAMSGPAGIGVAISAVLFIVQSATFIFAKLKKRAKETGEVVEVAAWNFDVLGASVADTKKVLDQLSFKQITDGVRALNAEYEKLQQTQEDLVEKSAAFTDVTGMGMVDDANLAKLKAAVKNEKDILEKQAAFRAKIMQAAGEGKISSDKINELMPVFESELARRTEALESLSDKANKKVRKQREDDVKSITEQMNKLTSFQKKLGDLENVELKLAEKRLALKQAQGDEARLAIKKEIDALEELQKKLSFKEEKDKDANKSKSGKSQAELDAEYAEARFDQENKLKVMSGERTQIEALAAKEARLEAELQTASGERRREIEIEIRDLAIQRYSLSQKAAADDEKNAQKHLENLDKIAEQELAIGAAQEKLAQRGSGGEADMPEFERRFQMNTAILQGEKQAATDRLKVLESEIDTSENLSQLEKDARIMQANELKEQLIEIEGEILDEKKRYSEQATDEEQKQAEKRKQLMAAAYQFVSNSIGQILSIQLQGAQARIDAEYDQRTATLERLRDEQLAHATTEQAKEQINAEFEQKAQQLEEETNAKRAAAQKKMFNFQKLQSIAEATMNTYTAATAALKAGPLLGPILAGIITASGLAMVATVAAQSAPSYAKGGLIRVSNGEHYFDEQTFSKHAPEIMALNESGRITGAGTGTSDSILAWANGGYILNARAAQMHGRRIDRFADGGSLNRDYGPQDYKPMIQQTDMTPIKDELSEIRRLLMNQARHPRNAKAVFDRFASAAAVEEGERELTRTGL